MDARFTPMLARLLACNITSVAICLRHNFDYFTEEPRHES